MRTVLVSMNRVMLSSRALMVERDCESKQDESRDDDDRAGDGRGKR